MKVSDCCSMGPSNEVGICPKCREHCDWVEEDEEDATQEIRAYGKEVARKLAGHLCDMKAQKATIPVTMLQKQYLVTVELLPGRDMTMKCTKCHQMKHVNDFNNCDECNDCVEKDPIPNNTGSQPCTDERMCNGCFAGTGCTNRHEADAVHASDCATHNEPAYPNGPCDCGVS